ncbi:MAG: EpsG family protein [Bacteroidales bacterium]|nr:EpsG family protein [Bacteroidales bacterium]
MTGAFILYNLALIVPLFFYLTRNNTRWSKWIVLGMLAIMGVLRYDIGWDYNGIVEYFFLVPGNDYSIFFKEPFLFGLCKVFSGWSRGFIGVFAVYYLLTLFFFYKALNYHQVVHEGLVFFITLGYLFITFDQVRQSLAISIFLFSLKFIAQREFPKFLICAFLAANAHFSALFVIPFYWILNARLKPWVYIIVTVGMIVLYYLDFWATIREPLFSIIPYYNKYAERPEYLLSKEATTGIGVLFFITFNSIIIFYHKLIDNRIVVNAVFVGLILFLFASGNLNITRISYYFSFALVITTALLLKNASSNLFRAIVLAVTLLWLQGLIYSNHAGCGIYKSIFTKEAREIKLMEDTINWNL